MSISPTLQKVIVGLVPLIILGINTTMSPFISLPISITLGLLTGYLMLFFSCRSEKDKKFNHKKSIALSIPISILYSLVVILPFVASYIPFGSPPLMILSKVLQSILPVIIICFASVGVYWPIQAKGGYCD